MKFHICTIIKDSLSVFFEHIWRYYSKWIHHKSAFVSLLKYYITILKYFNRKVKTDASNSNWIKLMKKMLKSIVNLPKNTIKLKSRRRYVRQSKVELLFFIYNVYIEKFWQKSKNRCFKYKLKENDLNHDKERIQFTKKQHQTKISPTLSAPK